MKIKPTHASSFRACILVNNYGLDIDVARAFKEGTPIVVDSNVGTALVSDGVGLELHEDTQTESEGTDGD